MQSIIKNRKYRIAPTIQDRAPWLAHGWRLYATKKYSEVIHLCSSLIRNDPACGQAWHLLGLAQHGRGAVRESIACLEKAVILEPGQPLHLNSLAVIHMDVNEYPKAAEYLEKALAMSPGHLDVATNLGLVRFYQNQPVKALACFDFVLSKDPRHSSAMANSGMVHAAMGNPAEAVRAYERALNIRPNQPKWLGNMGTAYLGLGRYDQAAHCFQQALAVSPHHHLYYIGLGFALRALNDWSGCIKALENAYRWSPENGSVLAELAVTYQHTCHWDKLPKIYEDLNAVTQSALAEHRKPDEQPLLSIRRTCDGNQNLAVARAWSCSAEERALKTGRSYHHVRHMSRDSVITVGYLSYDFRNHPVTHQLAPLFRMHDRSRFRVLAFSISPDDNSEFRRKMETDCDAFIDISGQGLARATDTVNRHQVDILIDLMGHTLNNRLEILALRPAPLQVGYLGFLASTGATFIDYLITDSVVAPPAHEHFYSEKLIRLPHCYQVNQRPDITAQPAERRADWGLPEDGVVFCSFNQAYKLDADLFAVWTRILNQVPGSVLWMGRDNPLAEQSLRRYALQNGIDDHRLIFADKVPLTRHLNRLKLADLALDTVGYNGGATTANALNAGVPVLTVMGGHWVSRMSASHLAAAGIPHLAVANLKAYEHMAVELATCPDMLQNIRSTLTADAPHATLPPLFRPELFVRYYEQALDMIWQRYQNHQPAEHITIAAAPDDARPDTAIRLNKATHVSLPKAVRGLQLLNAGRNQEAVHVLAQAAASNPMDYATLNNLGLAFHRAGQWDDAIQTFQRVLEINPAFVKAYHNLGNVYLDLKKTNAVIQCYQSALKVTPNDPQANYMMGQFYLEQLDVEHARIYYQKAVDLDPQFADAWISLATAALMQRDFKTGWPLYQWRFKTTAHHARIYPYHLPLPAWKGESYQHRTLLIHCEQGLGDSVQFARFLPRVKALGGTLIFQVQPSLMPLFSNLPYIDKLIPLVDTPPKNIDADLYIPLLDLPACLDINSENDFTMPSAYLHADNDQTARWQDRISPDRFNIGIVWSGNPLHKHHQRRSCDPADFIPLGRIDHVQMYSLQKEAAEEDIHMLSQACGIQHLGKALTCFGETAAAIQCLDLIISVDTAVAHLAGAMGKPVWLILPYLPDWRWQLHRSDTPWYPAMRLFRQTEPGNWQSVFASLLQTMTTELNNQRGIRDIR